MVLKNGLDRSGEAQRGRNGYQTLTVNNVMATNVME
jgi:hypothetical protein